MKKVRSDSLIPTQQTKDALKLLRSADCYIQWITKYLREPVICHSWPEVVHLGYLESQLKISNVVPQPFKLFVGTRRYIPDCYFEDAGKPIVVELKPRDSDNFDHIREPVEEYFRHHGIEFRMIWNEDVLEHQVLAENWLYIARLLCNAQTVDSDRAELKLLDQLYDSPKTLGDIIDYGDRAGACQDEVAIYRLAKRGKVQLELASEAINNQTKVSLCQPGS